MKKIGVILLGCCLGVLLTASVATAGPRGECNRILAKEVGALEKIHNGIDPAASCEDVVLGLIEILFSPADCIGLFNNGELFVKPGSGVTEDICDVLINTCGVGDLLPDGFCSV